MIDSCDSRSQTSVSGWMAEGASSVGCHPVARLNCADSGSKGCHTSKMAAPGKGIFWLPFFEGRFCKGRKWRRIVHILYHQWFDLVLGSMLELGLGSV